MQNCCFEKRCSERVIWACKCTGSYLYFCDRHITRHMKVPGDHVTECTIVELSQKQVKSFIPKFKALTKYLKECRKSIKESSKVLIKHIEEEARKALNRIKELHKAAVELISKRGISKKNYEIIQCIPIENLNCISYRVENAKKSIEIIYEFYDLE